MEGRYQLYLENEDQMTFTEKMNGIKQEIVSFFSKNNNQNKIKEIYEKVKNDSNFAKKEVMCEDLNISLNIYDEYLEGMTRFISECGSDEDEINDEWKSKYQKAINKDTPFIESIFGGVNNSPSQTTVLESLGNLEILIDFIPKIDKYLMESNIYKNSPGFPLFEKSVVEFSKTMVEHVIDEFCQLNTDDETGNNQAEEKVVKYKLFL